jgi:hypothetical protein
MVEVWFNLRDGGQLCLPRITEAEKEQALLLHHLAWQLPAQAFATNLPPSDLPTLWCKPSHFPKIPTLKINHLC